MKSAAPSRLRSALFHALRAAFRALPIGEARRDGLRQRFLDRFPTIRPDIPRGLSTTGAGRRALVHSGGRALGHVEHRLEPLPDPLPAMLVAFYLPQFHAIPENDDWWGKGFTEWRNVARALPQFEGHAQPRLPGDLGFYDLRNPQVMRDQARLAREYGIGAFCFYFYWFGGKTLLEAPLQQWLADPSIELPFCLCWANENWSRRWDGRAEDVLVAQSHSAEDDLAFIAHVADYLRDPRYLRVDGKPLLLVYRPGLLPDARATAGRWRAWCRDNGIGEICIAYVQSFERPDPTDIGFDAAVEFPPNLSTPPDITARQSLLNPDYQGQVLDWREVADDYASRALPAYRLFPGVNCGWDNEPRRTGRGRVFQHASPRRYRDWLVNTIKSRLPAASSRLVFINAWNEWAEGAVLEPDERLGHAWLDATRQALRLAAPTATAETARLPCVVIHAWYFAVLDELIEVLRDSGMQWRLLVSTTRESAESVRARLQSLGMPFELTISENRGRDILPFLRVANRLLDEGVEVVLKLHTKRSLHRQDGDAWRRDLVQKLAAPDRVRSLLHAFKEDPQLGLIGPEGHFQPVGDYLGANAEVLASMCSQLGLQETSVEDKEFVAGSMYWIRLAALRPLLDAHLDEWWFETEQGQIDGTMAHALERLIIPVVEEAGFTTTRASALGGDGMSAQTNFYDNGAAPRRR
jgi:lipopolysaccharide biosynthesis protein